MSDKTQIPIVSSAHLVSEQAAELSEYEFGLILATHAFSRWTTKCMAAAGYPELGPLEILVLHNCNHRDRAKRLSDLCFTLNIEDTHTVNYALKKLLKAQLLTREKIGKEQFYRTSEAGQNACQNYKEMREHCLISSFNDSDATTGIEKKEKLSEMARSLRALSGLYDQAARAASSM